MPFDLEGARRAGYSDAEIAAYLAERHRFNLEGARAAGYDDAEILEALIARDYEQPAASVTATRPAPFASWTEGLRERTATAAEPAQPQIPRAPLFDQLFAGFDEYRANRGLDRAVGQLETRETVRDIGAGRTLAIREGIERMRQAAGLGGDLADVPTAQTDPEIMMRQGEISSDLHRRFREGIAEQAQLRERAATVPFSPEVQRAAEAKTWGEFFDAFSDAPFRTIAETGVRSAPNMLEMIPATIMGGVAGGPVLAAIASGMASMNVEQRAAFAEALQEAGVDLTDPNAVEAAFNDPELMAEIERYMIARGVPIGLVDMLTMGAATRTLAPEAFRPLAREMTNLGAQSALQMAGGGLGETIAQLASTGELEPGQIGIEALAEGVTAPIDVATAVGAGLRPQQPQPRAPVPPGRTLPRPDMIVDTEGVARTRSRFEEEQRRRQQEAEILGRQPPAAGGHPGAARPVRPDEQIAPTEESGPIGLPPPATYVDSQGVARSTEQLEAALQLTDALFGREWARAADMGFTPDVAAAAERHPGRAGPAPEVDPGMLPGPDDRLFVDPAGQAQTITELEQREREAELADMAARRLADLLGLTPDVEQAARRHPGQARQGAGRRLEPPDTTLYGGPDVPPATSAQLEQQERSREAQDRARESLAAMLGLTPDVERAGAQHPGRPTASGAGGIVNTGLERESAPEPRSAPAAPEQGEQEIAAGAPQQPAAGPVSAPARAKGRRGADPTRHSALEYIAHVKATGAATGGINIDEAIAQGFDPADLKSMRVGIRRAFTKGGMSFDQAAELLAEAGYPVVDPQTGRYDANRVVDIIDRELRGERVISRQNQADMERMEQQRAEAEGGDFASQLVGGDRRREDYWIPEEDERRSGQDRRQDTEARKRVSQMSLEELREALLTSHLTGLRNRRAYDEAPRLPVQASIDVDSLKWVNDNMGHPSGDQLLRLVGDALRDEFGDEAYHFSGDEFVVQGVDEWDVQAALEAAQRRLAESYVEVELPDGEIIRVTGLGISFGIGGDLNAAETDLKAAKESRLRTGARAARGDQPPGATRIPPPGREDRGRSARAEAEAGRPLRREEEQADIFGDDVRAQQQLEDERRRRDARRSPDEDVPLETGDPSDLFSEARNQIDLVDQARQREREQQADDDEIVSQRDDDAPPLELTVSKSFASGTNRSADIAGAIEAGIPFGVDVGLISREQIEDLAAAAADGVPIFVDSGAFRLFRASQKGRASGQVEIFGEKIKAIDAAEVMRRYIALSEDAEHFGADPSDLTFVMPDVVGNGPETLRLLREHRDSIRALMDFGHEIVIPIQASEGLSAVDFANQVIELFKDAPTWRWGIPSNAEAMPDEQLTEFVRAVEPSQLHILGAVQRPTLQPRLKAIEAGYSGNYELDVSADGNVLRSSLDELAGKTGKERSEALARVLSTKLGGQQGVTRGELEGADEGRETRFGLDVGSRVRKRNGDVGTIQAFERVGKKDRARVRFDRGRDGKPYEQLVDVDKLESAEDPDGPDDDGGSALPSVREGPPQQTATRNVPRRRRRVRGQQAWHGSPYVFLNFSLAAIGRGEGSQAYGWGLYFTSKREIAEYYRQTLVQRMDTLQEERDAYSRARAEIDRLSELMLDETIKRFGIPQDALEKANDDALRGWGRLADPRHYMTPHPEVEAEFKQEWDRAVAEYQRADRALQDAVEGKTLKLKGRIYRVDIPKNSELMDWNRRIEEQPEHIQKRLFAAAREAGIRHPYEWWTGEELYERIASALIRPENIGANPQELASRLLNKHKIRGHYYIGDTSGARNFVIFDDAFVRVLDEAPFLEDPDSVREGRKPPFRVIEGGRRSGEAKEGEVFGIYAVRGIKRPDGAIDIVRVPVENAGPFSTIEAAAEYWQKIVGNVPGGRIVRTNLETWEADVQRAFSMFVEQAFPSLALEDELDEVLALISTSPDAKVTRDAARRFLKRYDAAKSTGGILDGDVLLVRAFLDGEDIAERRRKPPKNDKQLELLLQAPAVDTQQPAPRYEAARRAAVKALRDMANRASALGRRFSREMSRRRSASLVGKKIGSTFDLAFAAQIYRDPRFETLRTFFVDADGNVVAQIGISSRLPATSTGFIGPQVPGAAGAYYRKLAEKAKEAGAVAFYALHNHPSGNSTPSASDVMFTQSVAMHFKEAGIALKAHVVIDHNNYSVIDEHGNTHFQRDERLQSEDMGSKHPLGRFKFNGMAEFLWAAKDLFRPEKNRAVLILTDARYRVLNTVEIDRDFFSGKPRTDKRNMMRLLLAEPSANFLWAVTGDNELVKKLAPFVVDTAIVHDDGRVRSYRSLTYSQPQEVFPDSRPAVISPDTSEVFDYLREESRQVRASENRRAGRGRFGGLGDNVRQDAFHASPYEFDEFDISKVGTGEGNQAFGHGLYFAENPGVARSYLRNAEGFLYEVEIPDSAVERMIDLGKKLAEDSPTVQNAVKRVLRELGLRPSDFSAEENGYSIVTRALERKDNEISPAEAQRRASELLLKQGIPGNTYLDAGSRGQGTGTRNIVLFDPSIAKIKRRTRSDATDVREGGRLQVDTPSFRLWFGASKVVDRNGRPLVLYHGTNKVFTAFDPRRDRDGNGAVWFTTDTEMASAFSLFRSTWNSANLVPTYVRAVKLLEIDAKHQGIRWIESETSRYSHLRKQFPGMQFGENLHAYAQRMGYDGIVFRNARDQVGPRLLRTADVYAFYETASFKSAIGNQGTFDPNDPDIVREGKKPGEEIERQAGEAYVPLFQGGQEAPQQGQPVNVRGRTVDPPQDGKPIRREHIMELLQRLFGVKIYQGKPFAAGRSTLGFFRPRNFEVRIKYKNDLEVTAHEFFHWLDRTYPTIRALYHERRFSKQLKSISYDASKIFEGFAEFGRLFLTQETEAATRAPEFYEAFVAEARALGILEKLEQVQERMHAWYNQGAEARAKSKIGKGPAPIGERLTAAVNGWHDRAIAAALDKYHAAKVIERETTGTIAADATQSAYKSMRLLAGARSAINSFLNYGTLEWDSRGDLVFNGKGLKQIFEPVADVLDDALAYFVGRRAAELAKYGKENLFAPDEIKALLDRGRNSPKRAEIEEAFREYQRYTKRLTSFAVQSGILSRETKELWERLYQNYVPFYRVAERLGNLDQRMTGTAGVFKRLTGGSANIRDVWENMTLNTALIVHASLKNMAKRQLFATIERSPVGQRYAVRIPAAVEARKVQMEQIERVLRELARKAREQYQQARASGQTAAAAELAEISMLAEELGARGPGQMPIADVQDQATMFFAGEPPKIPDKDSVMVGGRRVWFQIGDPMLWDMLVELNYHKPLGLTEQVFGVAKRALTRGVTITPDFQFANMVRDTLNAFTMSRGGQIPFVDSLRALRDIWTESEDFKLFLANGGGFGNAVGDEARRVRVRMRQSGVRLRGILDTPAAIADFWDKWGQSFELATRLAEFKRMRAQGSSLREAAFQGREISSDFAMHGLSNLSRWAMLSVAFFNARLQGLYRIERELFEREGRQRLRGERLLAYGTRAFLGLTMPSVLLYLFLNRGDDDYEALPEEVKSLYSVIPAPDGDGVLLIPRPFETGALFQEIPIRVLERMLGGEDEKLVDAFRFMIAETFAFSPVPTIAQPPLEIAINRQWNGLPVVPQNLQQVEPREQYRAWTPETYKRIGAQFNVSPLKLQALVEGYFGTIATYITAGTDALIGATEDTGEPPRRTLQSYPVLRRFVREQPYRSTSYEQEFYELLDEVAITANTLRKMVREAREADALEYISPDERALIFGLEGVTREIADRASTINQQIRSITSDRDLSGDEKRRQIDELQREQNELFRQAIEAVSAEQLERMIRQMEGLEP